MKRTSTCFSIVALALGCSSQAPPSAKTSRPSAAAPAQPDAPKAEAPPPLPMPPGVEVSFADELALVQEVRELRASEPVRGLRIAEGDLLAHLKGSFAREVPPHALEGTEEMLRLLGVVPVDFDYERTVLSLLKQQLAGLYDPRLNAMFVRDHLEGAELEATLYHELVHALQDQAYHLDDFSQWKEDGTDRASALSALAEGDATSAMYDGLFAVVAQRSGTRRKTALDISNAEMLVGLDAAADVQGDDGVPPIVRRSLIAPYRDGLLFVQTLRRRGGWKLVNDAFEEPPASTEQILHPERYFAHEPPLSVSVIAPPGEGFEKVLSDVWGEQSVRLLFEESSSRQKAAQDAAGWGGDRIAVFSRGEERILTWNLVLDDEAAADRYLRGLSQGATVVSGSHFCLERGAIGPLLGAKNGERVIVLAGPRAGKKAAGGDCTAGLAWAKQELAR